MFDGTVAKANKTIRLTNVLCTESETELVFVFNKYVNCMRIDWRHFSIAIEIRFIGPGKSEINKYEDGKFDRHKRTQFHNFEPEAERAHTAKMEIK